MPRPAAPAATRVIGPRHPSVKRLRRLSRRRSARTGEGLFVIDGPVLLAEALDAGVALVEVVAEASTPPGLLDRAGAAGAAVRRVADGTLAAATDTTTPQAVAAVASLEGAAAPLPRAVAAAGPLALVLVGIADPGNAGTLVRSAEAAGAGAVIFCDDAVDPFGPKCVRSSAGSLFRLAVVRSAGAGEALEAVRRAGGTTVATVARGPYPAYYGVDLSGRSGTVALALGSEAHGLPGGLLGPELIDTVVTIPMAGRTESLNVAMAGTILCFEAFRQRRADRTNRLDGPPAQTAGWPAT